MTRVVTLIPWRPAGDRQRIFNWDVARPHLEALGYPIFTGEPRTPEWSRAEAVNAAAAEAGKWDVALVGDADTLPDPGSVRRAIAWVRDTEGGARPHLDRWDLTASSTLRIAQGVDPRTLRGKDRKPQPGGGLMVIHRKAFEALEGYDETFRGWGFEDTAMNLALIRRGLFDRLPGECWHLWHDESGWRGATEASKAKHRRLMVEYADDVAEFVANKGWSTPPGEDVVTPTPTPHIFHRVWFPADETDVVPPKFEGFWDRLKELHPDWDFVTHDDPDEVQGWLTNAELFQKVRDAAAADPERYKDFAYGSLPDIVRYEVCNRFGGVYIDVDFEPLKPFDELADRGVPFIGWESFEFVCCALMGGPPGHPAFSDLIENLPAHAEEWWDEAAVHRTGPRFITERWVNRTDVLRLPPVTFYPVCWNERDRLGGPYPEDTIAVHHWNAGWIPKEEKAAKGLLNVVVLIPWRGGDPDRELAWSKVEARWNETEFPVYVADSPSKKKFNRAAAINAAAKAAGDWDIAIIADADTWDNVSACRRAIDWVGRNGGASVPWNARLKLSREGTLRFLEMGRKKSVKSGDLDRDDPTRTNGTPPNKRGGAIVVDRATFDSVGGFDEGFTDWGHEDRAFRLAVETLTDRRLPDLSAKVFHLWHPLASTDRKGTPKGRERFARYEEAHGDREAMLLLLKDLGMKKPPVPSA